MAAKDEPIRYDKDYPTKYDGVYFRYSKKRLHNGKPDKAFKIRYRINGRSKNERIGWLSEGYSAEFARDIRAKRIVSIRHGEELPNNKKLTFGAAAKRYLDDHANNKSIREDHYRYNDLKPLESMEISQITIADIKKVYNSMRERGVKNATYLRVEGLYNRIVKYASDVGLIKAQARLRMPIPRQDTKVTEVYTDEMLTDYLSVIEQYPYRVVADIVELIYYTGMRRSEPPKLKWTDYNELEGYVTIQDAKSGRDERKRLSTSSLEIIERQRRKSKIYIFEVVPGEPVRGQYISYHARRMADMAGLPPHYRPLHSLRHNVGTQMAMQGTPAPLIQEFLNHKKLDTTQRYIDIAEKKLQGHIDMLENGLKKPTKADMLKLEKYDVEPKVE